MKITTNQLQTTLAQASAFQKNSSNAPANNDIKLKNLDIKNIYIGRDNKVHVSNSGFAAQNWLGKMLYGAKASGNEALMMAMEKAGIAPDVRASAMTNVIGARLFGVQTIGGAISKAAAELKQKFEPESKEGLEAKLHSLEMKFEEVERKRSNLDVQQKEKKREIAYWDDTGRTVTRDENISQLNLSKDLQGLKSKDADLHDKAESLKKEIEETREKLGKISPQSSKVETSPKESDEKMAFSPSGDIMDRQMADELVKTYRYLNDIRP